MVQVISSAYYGVCFPHTVVCDEDNNKVYIILYEACSAKFSVKAITSIELMEQCIKDYNPEWDLESFMDKKEPIMMAVTGEMEQQVIGRSFLGPVYEEKFHVKCLSAFILPCVPLIPEHMKFMVHPDISPNQFEEGTRAGYYMVNLSLNQTFGQSEFHPANENDNGADEDMDRENQNELHSDNDEIDSDEDEDLVLDAQENNRNPANEDSEAEGDAGDDAGDNGNNFENLDEFQEAMNQQENVDDADNNDDYSMEIDSAEGINNGLGIGQLNSEIYDSDNSSLASELQDIVNRDKATNERHRRAASIATSESQNARFPVEDTSECPVAQSDVVSVASTSSGIVRKMKNTRLSSKSLSRSSSDLSSTTSAVSGTGAKTTFRYGRNNTTQNTLDKYISSKRLNVEASSFFGTNSLNKTRNSTAGENSLSINSTQSNNETQERDTSSECDTPKSQKRAFTMIETAKEDKSNGKERPRKRLIVEDSSGDDNGTQTSLEESNNLACHTSQQVVDGLLNDTSSRAFSSSAVGNKERKDKGKGKEDSSKIIEKDKDREDKDKDKEKEDKRKTKSKSKKSGSGSGSDAKSKGSRKARDETGKSKSRSKKGAYGSMEQHVLFFSKS